ncbi:hypothetical protein EKO23_22995 [Nocardioides guangzhouensis]|uniref:Fibronectin type III domain-containing protein n=1 Tax=Nocardioides guangzhouensis TaxID=2497878 RepID=A0A4V1XY33_9ACTN|nr:hypothetical protein [Nocardioides guangzhouensis]RYP81849.1 hypothetical protein EKO23_22995 [Nocardioides guangzhouensis]
MRTTGRHARSLVFGLVAAASIGAATLRGVPAVADPPEVWVSGAALSLGDAADAASVDLDDGAAVWLATQGGSTRVMYSGMSGSGTWMSPLALSAPGVIVDQPSVFTDGNTVVAWRVFDGTHWQIQARMKLGDATVWSEPTTFTSADGDAVEPLALVTYYYDRWTETLPRVLWRRNDGSNWRLQYGSLRDDGGSESGEYVTPAGDEVRDVTHIPGNGYEYVSWSRFDGSRWLGEAVDASDPEPPFWNIGPATEDVLEPSFAGDVDVWRTPSDGVTRVRAVCATTCSDPAVYLSPAGLDTEELAAAGWTDNAYRRHGLVAWRQHDGSSWRIAVRTKTAGAGWSARAYLSPAGVDASAPSVAPGQFADGELSSVIVAWTEESASGPIARAAVFGEATPPEPTTLSVAGEKVTGTVGLTWNGVAAAWVSGAPEAAAVQVRGFDVTGPRSDVRPFGGNGIQPTALVRWSALDDWSPVAVYDVRRSELRWNQSRWSRWQVMTDTNATSDTMRFPAGATTCVAARARDSLGHVGAWSYSSCVTRPVDDRVLTRHGRWQARTGERYYKGTYLTTRRKGASLVLGPFPRSFDQAVLVAVGPGNGKVRVDSRCGKEWRFNRTLDLHSTKNRTLVKRWVNNRWECPGGLRITVLSEGKPVRIDGVYAPPRNTP